MSRRRLPATSTSGKRNFSTWRDGKRGPPRLRRTGRRAPATGRSTGAAWPCTGPSRKTCGRTRASSRGQRRTAGACGGRASTFTPSGSGKRFLPGGSRKPSASCALHRKNRKGFATRPPSPAFSTQGRGGYSLRRSQLEHVIRAASSIADDREIIVIGSQAILGQFPDAPLSLLTSVEADVIPKNRPELAELVEGSIGEGSRFHATFAHYGNGVGLDTAVLPAGWDQRPVKIQNENTMGATGGGLGA